MDLVQCQWCHSQCPSGASSCDTCGAPLDPRDVIVSDSGWRETPRLDDLTEFGFANSKAQIEGELTPVIELTLAAGDAVYFEPHVLLWKEEQTHLSAKNIGGSLKRSLAGLPFQLCVANGPGRAAFSKDAPGSLVVLPMQPGVEIDVREHAFLAATHAVDYSFVQIKGLANVLHGGEGMFMDRFIAQAPGLLILHGNGNDFQRVLGPGEKVLVEPGAFLYKDASVQMNTVQQRLRAGLLRHNMYLAELTGPGRVGVQSLYVHHHAN